MEAIFLCVTSSLVDFGEGLGDEDLRQGTLPFDFNANGTLVARHVFRHVINLAANNHFTDCFTCLVSECVFQAIGSANPGHTNVCKVALWLEITLGFFADRR